MQLLYKIRELRRSIYRQLVSILQTNLGGQHNAYHGFFYVEEHPPPPPPHAYEIQSAYHPAHQQMGRNSHLAHQQGPTTPHHQIMAYQNMNQCCAPIYSEPPPISASINCDENQRNNMPVPMPRSFEMVPYVEQEQQGEVVESVTASRRSVKKV